MSVLIDMIPVLTYYRQGLFVQKTAAFFNDMWGLCRLLGKKTSCFIDHDHL